MDRKLHHLQLQLAAILTLAFIPAATPWSSPAQEPGSPADSQPTLADLHREHIETLRKLVDVVTAQHQDSLVSYNVVIAAQNRLLQARLEAASSTRARLALRAELVENLKAFEKVAQARLESGNASQDELLGARAARLKAEIALLREQDTQ